MMNERPNPSSTRRAARRRAAERRGVTLVEVLAGLVLLGTVLASVMIARGRFLRQWAQAEQRLAAVRAADGMVSRWMSAGPQAVPVPAQGPVDDLPNYAWRTRWVPNRQADELSAGVARLEVFATRADSGFDRNAPVVSVDFLVHQFPRLPGVPNNGQVRQSSPAPGVNR
jgi:prepilin-type N-terminal cleavage/methylation domain-containing protein